MSLGLLTCSITSVNTIKSNPFTPSGAYGWRPPERIFTPLFAAIIAEVASYSVPYTLTPYSLKQTIKSPSPQPTSKAVFIYRSRIKDEANLFIFKNVIGVGITEPLWYAEYTEFNSLTEGLREEKTKEQFWQSTRKWGAYLGMRFKLILPQTKQWLKSDVDPVVVMDVVKTI